METLCVQKTETAKRLVEQANAAHKEIEEVRGRVIDELSHAATLVVSVGAALIEVRRLVQGEFDGLLESSCAFSPKLADHYMNFAVKHGPEIAAGTFTAQAQRALQLTLSPIEEHAQSQSRVEDQCHSFWTMVQKIEVWIPNLNKNQLPRVKSWWQKIGERYGWI